MKTALASINETLPAIEVQKIRTLKIQPLIRVSRWSDDTTVPEIRLCGAWLAKLGFCYGEKVEVRTSEGKLVITPVREDR
jgi:toxic protein SymE